MSNVDSRGDTIDWYMPTRVQALPVWWGCPRQLKGPLLEAIKRVGWWRSSFEGAVRSWIDNDNCMETMPRDNN